MNKRIKLQKKGKLSKIPLFKENVCLRGHPQGERSRQTTHGLLTPPCEFLTVSVVFSSLTCERTPFPLCRTGSTLGPRLKHSLRSWHRLWSGATERIIGYRGHFTVYNAPVLPWLRQTSRLAGIRVKGRRGTYCASSAEELDCATFTTKPTNAS